MKKLDQYLTTRVQCYREWHQDHRTPYLSWAILIALASVAVNVIMFATNLEAYQGENTPVATLSRRPVVSATLPIETDRIIVKFNPNKIPPGLSVAAAHANLAQAEGLTKLLTISGIDAVVYQVSANDTAREVVDRMLAKDTQKTIQYAEVDMMLPPAYIPNDPSFGSEWHLQKIGAPTAWDMAKGDGVIVATLDSGVDATHPDLAATIVPGWNFYDNNSNTADVYGHGTKVAGAMTAIGDNAQGVAGVAMSAKNMPIRVTDASGMGYLSMMASGITYAADHGARVANLSFEAAGTFATVQSAASYMRAKGGVVVTASGNSGAQNTSTPSDTTVVVSATDSNDARASWSNYGDYVDVASPGVGVMTTTVGGGYAGISGTSIASPVTAAVYALLFSVNPNLTAAQADSILYQTSVDLGTPGWDMYYGYGRVDAAAAVALAASTTGALNAIDRTAPSVPVNLMASTISATAVSLTWNPALDNVAVTQYVIYRNGVKVGTSAGTTYVDTTVSGNTTYTYTASARDAAGNESGQSAPLSVVTPTAPLSLAGIAVTIKTGGTATLTVNTNKAATVTVRYGTVATNLNMSVSGMSAATTQTVTLSGLKSKTKYFYQVVATSGTETASSAVSNFRTAAK